MATKSIVNWLNKTLDFTNLLKSRIILYIFFVLSIAQLYTYSVTYDYLYAAIFILVGFLVSFFSKNMIVIMCFALSLSYMLKYGDSIRDTREGMNTKLDEGDLKDNDTLTIDKNVSSKKVSDDMEKLLDILPAKTNDSGKSDTVIPKKTEDKSSEDNNIKKIKKTMDKLDPGMDKETQAEYKNLLELQLKLIDGISNMQPVLSEVAKKIDSMKNTMKSPGF